MLPLRGRVVVRRLAVLRRVVLAAPVARFVADADPVLRALDARVEAAAEVFALVAVFRLVAVLRVPVERLDALLRPPLVARCAVPRDDPELALASPSNDHFPDITRCAASATASAMREPSLVALVTTLVAACDAESAASKPASRILRRAAGLALIAAAAAASPAASISLLIAAFASLSTVSFPEDFEELVLADFAIASLPARAVKIALPL